MAKTQYCVRIVLFGSDAESAILNTLLECFRYAGLVKLGPDNGNSMSFDIRCPQGLNSKIWAEQNAARIKSFGLNAVAAPAQLPHDETVYDLV